MILEPKSQKLGYDLNFETSQNLAMWGAIYIFKLASSLKKMPYNLSKELSEADLEIMK